ncbi:type IX secretion system outer membrane channel protein PorV [Robertkochia flava]|uniref:type IX secretion system outer membrane channel protein PorV n=1 Tax=Robertkochia flava TaxID=3447986 RepID=UPI001CCE75B6|nr:type IX secretion system outer membrane channel protein PorV [Robertkochia marina]
MKKLLFWILLLPLSVKVGLAQENSGVQTTAAPFLLIVPDARSGGMADMGVATSTDANSQFFNAAKYAFMEEDMLVGLNYTPWLRNLTNEVFLGSFSFAKRIDERSTWGVGMRYFSLGAIQLSDGAGNGMGTETPYELALDGSYSLKLSENFAMAVSGRYVRSDYALRVENSDLRTVNTVVADVGGYYESDLQQIGKMQGIWRAGLSLNNIGSKVELVEGAEKSQMPTTLKLGTGYEFLLDAKNSLTTNLELNSLLVSNNDIGSLIYALGAEYKYNNVFALRTGYFHEGENSGNRQFASFGGGVAFRNARLDISYLVNTSDVVSPLENTLRFSLSFVFGNNANVQQNSTDDVAALN